MKSVRPHHIVLTVAAAGILVYLVNSNSVPASTRQIETEKSQTGDAAVPEATWPLLRGLDGITGSATADLRALDGKPVRIAGYLVPLDDDLKSFSEFLLVPYAGACVHTPPPPPNQMIYVKIEGGRRIKGSLFEAVWTYGKLNIARRNSPYGRVFYSMDADRVEPFE